MENMIGTAFYKLVGKDKVAQSDKVKVLVEKWAQTPLLTSKKYSFKEDQKGVVAQLLENTANEIADKIRGNSRLLTEETTTGNGIATINTIAFPVVVKAWKKLIAPEIVSVQPLSMPTSYVFYLDYRIDTAKGRFSNGASILGAPYGKLIESGATISITEPFYNMASSYSEYVVSCSTIDIATTGTANWYDVNYYPALSGTTVYYADIPIAQLTSSTGSCALDRLWQLMITSRSTTDTSIYPIFSSQSGANIRVFAGTKIGWDYIPTARITASWVAVGAVTCSGLEGYTVTNESNLASTTPVPAIAEIGIQFEKKAIEAQNRKLRATWSNEVAQDMEAYLGYNAEQLMSNLLSDLISYEIDQMIIEDLYRMARLSGTNFIWSYIPGRIITDHTNGDYTSASGYETTFTWLQTLFITINQASSVIYQKTRRVGANFLVCSPRVGALIKTIPGFMPDVSDKEDDTFSVGMQKIGVVNGQYKVFVDPLVPTTEILIGYKGNSPVDSGYVFAPYVPAMVFETVRRYTDFNPTKGIMSRVAQVPLRVDFYGTVVIRDLPNY